MLRPILTVAAPIMTPAPAATVFFGHRFPQSTGILAIPGDANCMRDISSDSTSAFLASTSNSSILGQLHPCSTMFNHVQTRFTHVHPPKEVAPCTSSSVSSSMSKNTSTSASKRNISSARRVGAPGVSATPNHYESFGAPPEGSLAKHSKIAET